MSRIKSIFHCQLFRISKDQADSQHAISFSAKNLLFYCYFDDDSKFNLFISYFFN